MDTPKIKIFVLCHFMNVRLVTIHDHFRLKNKKAAGTEPVCRVSACGIMLYFNNSFTLFCTAE